MEITATESIRTPANDAMSNYEELSKLFEYPHTEAACEDWLSVCRSIAATLPFAVNVIEPFAEFIRNSTLTEIQELFLRSFDVQAITTLDIGYILFGEDYKRGELLVNLNREHREAGNVCETELSDHLPNVLRLIPKIQDAELREELVQVLVIPAMEKMIAEFELRKIEKKDEVYKKHLKTVLDYSQTYRVAYQAALQVTVMALKHDFVPVHECECCSDHTNDTHAHHSGAMILEATCDHTTGTCTSTKVPTDFGGTIENEFEVENQ